LAADPNAKSGTYTIDPDGPSSSTYKPRTVECDMSTDGGGWTRVAFEDFQSSTSGWSTTNTITQCGKYGKILGGYCEIAGDTNAKTYSVEGVPHSEARLSLEYLKIDSWGSSDEEGFVTLAGEDIFRKEFCACRHGCQKQGGICGGEHVCGMNRKGSNASVDDLEREISVEGTVSHSSTSDIRVAAGSNLDQDPCDESWGIDDIEVWVR
jgi:hypothetical protein